MNLYSNMIKQPPKRKKNRKAIREKTFAELKAMHQKMVERALKQTEINKKDPNYYKNLSKLGVEARSETKKV